MARLIVSFIGSLVFVVVANAAAPTGRYKVIVDRMNTLVQKYPQLAQVLSIGPNDDGTEIFAMRISTTPSVVDAQKVGHLMVATHHGNESAAPLFAMAFIEDLLKRYQTGELWRGELADTEWSIIPVLNISGYNRNERQEHGIDPNRDYPAPCMTGPTGQLKSINQLMAFMGSRVFSGSVTVHGYVGVLAYPWGMFVDNDHSLDHNQFDEITKKAAAVNNYQYGTSAETIYPANGCYEDYAYAKFGMWSLLLELESGSTSDINATVKAIAKYYDLLTSSPSTHNQLTGNCLDARRLPDLRLD